MRPGPWITSGECLGCYLPVSSLSGKDFFCFSCTMSYTFWGCSGLSCELWQCRVSSWASELDRMLILFTLLTEDCNGLEIVRCTFRPCEWSLFGLQLCDIGCLVEHSLCGGTQVGGRAISRWRVPRANCGDLRRGGWRGGSAVIWEALQCAPPAALWLCVSRHHAALTGDYLP